MGLIKFEFSAVTGLGIVDGFSGVMRFELSAVTDLGIVDGVSGEELTACVGSAEDVCSGDASFVEMSCRRDLISRRPLSSEDTLSSNDTA